MRRVEFATFVLAVMAVLALITPMQAGHAKSTGTVKIELYRDDTMQLVGVSNTASFSTPVVLGLTATYQTPGPVDWGVVARVIKILGAGIAAGTGTLTEYLSAIAIADLFVDIHSTTEFHFPPYNVTFNGTGTWSFTLDVTITEVSGSVGGIAIPVDKFGLLAPYIGLASTTLVGTAAIAIYVKRVKRRKEKQ
jgi:hypothetical protein